MIVHGGDARPKLHVGTARESPKGSKDLGKARMAFPTAFPIFGLPNSLGLVWPVPGFEWAKVFGEFLP